MASISVVMRKKGTAVYIAYRIKRNGKCVQIKYRCKDREDAEHRLPDVIAAEQENRIYVTYESPDYTAGATTVSDLVETYLDHHAKNISAHTLANYIHIFEHYIKPFIGSLPLKNVTTAVLQRYYDDLPNHPAAQGNHITPAGNISPRTVREVHKILRPAFRLAVRWDWIPANPASELELPPLEVFERKQWTEEEVVSFIGRCGDAKLARAIAVAFACTLRSGELCGLKRGDLVIDEDSIRAGNCQVRVNKTLERIDREAMGKARKDVVFQFPTSKIGAKTVRVLKKPKTKASVRTIYIPPSVSLLLQEHLAEQDREKEALGDLYQDYGLLFCHENGEPFSTDYVGKKFKREVERLGMEMVDCYSIRHSGATAKLRATGDIKAVQADMGHATVSMLLNVYATFRDDDRRKMAMEMDKKWFDHLQFSEENEDFLDDTDNPV